MGQSSMLPGPTSSIERWPMPGNPALAEPNPAPLVLCVGRAFLSCLFGFHSLTYYAVGDSNVPRLQPGRRSTRRFAPRRGRRRALPSGWTLIV